MTLIISDYNGHNGRLVRTAGHLVFIVWITLIKIITPLDTGRGRTGPGPARPRHNCGKSGAIFNRPLPFSRWHAKWGRDKQGDQQCPALCPALISRHTQPLPCRGGWRQRPDLHTSDRTLSTSDNTPNNSTQHDTSNTAHQIKLGSCAVSGWRLSWGWVRSHPNHVFDTGLGCAAGRAAVPTFL